jgi:hypothetical protein
MHAVKGLLKLQTQMAFVRAFQSVYRHQRIAARVFRILAGRDLDVVRRGVILIMADRADRRAQHYAVRLRRLGSNLRPEDENWSDRLWFTLLIHSSVSLAIRWIEWVEHRDSSELASLINTHIFWH